MPAILETLGHRVRALRVANGITQQDLADRVGLSRTSITNVEAGQQGDIGVMKLIAFAEALGTTVTDLTGTVPSAVDTSPWLELARRVHQSERTYGRLAEECWESHDYHDAIRYRGVAEGLRMAHGHHADVIAELKSGGSDA